MNVEQLPPTRSSRADPNSCRVSLPAFPDSAFCHQRPASEDDSCQTLPDHFPQPYIAADQLQDHQHMAQRSPVAPGTSQKMVFCQTQQMVKNQMHDLQNGVRGPDEVKEGLRRITDKYAAPSVLHMNGSVCSSDAYTPSVSPIENLPVSPSVSTNISTSPTSSGISSSPVMNGGHSVDSNNTHRSNVCVQNPVAKQNGHAQRLAPLSISAFSDVSSDFSDTSPTVRSGSMSGGRGGLLGVGSGRYQSVSGIALTTSLGDGVTDEDVQQVEMFYRSHKSDVTVCHSLANLYFGSVVTAANNSTLPRSTANGRLSPASGSDLWEFVTTGIPLLVLDSGDHHRSRQLSIVVAEKGTGFVLWKDVVSHLTEYSCPHTNFHTLRISSDSNKLAGLSFDDSKAAASFAADILKLTSDPDDELLMLSKKGKKKKKKQESKKKQKFKPPKKTDISQPCCFQHVTKLERPQITGLTPLPPNGFPPAPGGSVSSLSDVFQDRLTVSVSRGRSPSSELSDASAEH